ncbi:hypothetical protein [Pontibacter burrus]|uniref:DUF4890 domain-containing protein n=1 Tax=Pontibacter burrus TaxID=2704466 RepID=A0A6B3LZB9_9BACT|nr:hypothetical protein [Pontibacter burrus]NEM99686.1 hypothetical protein [Pontibacter burrus]
MKTNLLKKAFVLGLGLFLSVGAMAQQGQHDKARKQLTPAERQEKMLENYKKNLDLSDAQTQKLKAINQKHVQEMQALRNDQNLTRDAKKEKMKALQASREAEVTAILNADQKQKYATWKAEKAERKQKMRMKHEGKRGQRPLKQGK